MSAVADRFLSELLQLSPADRGEVAARLLDSLDGIDDSDDDAAWEAELTRRIEDVQSGRVQAVSLEEARRQLLQDASEDNDGKG